jgi:organic radical activating enzyme
MNKQKIKRSILGTGNFGALVHDVLLENGITVDRFLDLNPRNHGKVFLNLPIESTNFISPGEVIYIASNRNNQKYLREHCSEIAPSVEFPAILDLLKTSSGSFKSVSWDHERCKAEIDNYCRLFESNDRFFRSLDIVLTEKCTLKCKDCSNLMQYYQKPQNASINMLLRDLRLLERVGLRFEELRLIGGEPLVFKEIDSVLQLLENSVLGNKLVLFTNGTIVPRATTLDLLKRCNVRVQISRYSGDLSKNCDRLTTALLSANVAYTIEDVFSWNDCGQIVRVSASEEQVAKTFANCCVNDAFTLLHGRLYGCPFAAHFHNLNESTEYFGSDWVELATISSDSLLSSIIRLRSVPYYSACWSCKGRDYESAIVPAAVQAEIPLTFQRRLS